MIQHDEENPLETTEIFSAPQNTKLNIILQQKTKIFHEVYQMICKEKDVAARNKINMFLLQYYDDNVEDVPLYQYLIKCIQEDNGLRDGQSVLVKNLQYYNARYLQWDRIEQENIKTQLDKTDKTDKDENDKLDDIVKEFLTPLPSKEVMTGNILRSDQPNELAVLISEACAGIIGGIVDLWIKNYKESVVKITLGEVNNIIVGYLSVTADKDTRSLVLPKIQEKLPPPFHVTDYNSCKAKDIFKDILIRLEIVKSEIAGIGNKELIESQYRRTSDSVLLACLLLPHTAREIQKGLLQIQEIYQSKRELERNNEVDLEEMEIEENTSGPRN